MLTRQESERKHKEILIDEGASDEEKDRDSKRIEESSAKNSNIRYFQGKASPPASSKLDETQNIKKSDNNNN